MNVAPNELGIACIFFEDSELCIEGESLVRRRRAIRLEVAILAVYIECLEIHELEKWIPRPVGGLWRRVGREGVAGRIELKSNF